MTKTMTPEELRERRERMGLSQMNMASALGVHITTVIGWERGRHPMPCYLALALAEIERAKITKKAKGEGEGETE